MRVGFVPDRPSSPVDVPLQYMPDCSHPLIMVPTTERGPPTFPPYPIVFARYEHDSRGVKCDCYRVPALARAPNGSLLAFAEGRYRGCHPDVSPANEGVLRISLDRAGTAWGAIRPIILVPGRSVNYPQPLVDGDVVHLFHQRLMGSKEGEGVWRMLSRDSGLTWTHPVQIPKSVATYFGVGALLPPALPLDPPPWAAGAAARRVSASRRLVVPSASRRLVVPCTALNGTTALYRACRSDARLVLRCSCVRRQVAV